MIVETDRADIAGQEARRRCANMNLRRGELRPANPLFETIRAILADSTIGDVFHGEVDYLHGITKNIGIPGSANAPSEALHC